VLLTASGAIGVLDWESAEPQGLPALDLIYFLTYLAFFYDGAIKSGRFRESYRMARDGVGLTGKVFHSCLDRYAAAVGVDRAALPALRILAWMLHARSEHRRMVADVGGPPSAEMLRQSLFLGLWQEELWHYAGRQNVWVGERGQL
jgi:aminoglycoside phosphotransferase (APT) family kinase protein